MRQQQECGEIVNAFGELAGALFDGDGFHLGADRSLARTGKRGKSVWRWL